jgi:16S rRNA processing protein RimM
VERGVLPELPAQEEEFYYADLIGLAVELADGTTFGEVKAVHDFGAGDLLELQPLNSGGKVQETIMVPFDRDTVPEIDLINRRLVFVAPVERDGDDDDGGR